MREITTTDLSKFGYRGLNRLQYLIEALIQQDFPQDFIKDGVVAMLNRNSDNVFLTNSEYHVAMLNDEKLEIWYHCSNCGHEGFAEDCQLCEDGCNECQKEKQE